MAYPIAFASDFTEDRSRVSTFFRLFLAIPHMLVLAVYSMAAFVTIMISWFAVVFTGRYPGGLYAFNGNYLRYATRVSAYLSLATDQYPAFGGSESSDYPVRVAIEPALPEYSRMKALFRIILLIPVALIANALAAVTQVAAFITWFWVLVTGKQNPGLHSLINLGLSYNAKANGYYMLITETWPPFSDDKVLTAGDPPPAALA